MQLSVHHCLSPQASPFPVPCSSLSTHVYSASSLLIASPICLGHPCQASIRLDCNSELRLQTQMPLLLHVCCLAQLKSLDKHLWKGSREESEVELNVEVCFVGNRSKLSKLWQRLLSGYALQAMLVMFELTDFTYPIFLLSQPNHSTYC